VPAKAERSTQPERALAIAGEIRGQSFREAATKWNIGYSTWRAIKSGDQKAYLPRVRGDRVSPEVVESILASVKTMPQLNTASRAKALGFRVERVQRVLTAASMSRLAARLQFAGYSLAPSNSLAAARLRRVVAAAPGCYTALDFKYFGQLPGGNGTPRRRICGLVAIDQLTGYLDVLLCPTETGDMAAAGLRRYVKRAPFPVSGLVLTDNGSHFTGDTFLKAAAALKLILRTTKYHHPWSNGKVEKANRTLCNECFPAILTGVVADIFALQDLVDVWLDFYNNKRQHGGWINGGLPPVAFYRQWEKAAGTHPLERLVAMGVLGQQDLEFVRQMGANVIGGTGKDRGRRHVYSETNVPYAFILDLAAKQNASDLRKQAAAATTAAQSLTSVTNVELALGRSKRTRRSQPLPPLRRLLQLPAPAADSKH
jgi:transposase InsO family protein